MPQPANELTLHIALATTPRKQEKDYAKQLEEHFYDQYRKDTYDYYKDARTKIDEYYSLPGTDPSTPSLYNPLKYYVLGNYDIVFISLVDSYKFAQKLFAPKTGNAGEGLNPNSFQILTGITPPEIKTDEQLRAFFEKRLRKDQPVHNSFIGIANLKLNNGLLIGTGETFFQKSIMLIKELLNELLVDENDDYLIVRSFSWFEISLLIFIEDPSAIGRIVTRLRTKTVTDLFTDEKETKDFIRGTVYYKNDEDIPLIKNSHVFADTHTYFGVHAVEFMKPDFLDRFANKKIDLKTEIEWQIKPGHLHSLVQEIDQHFEGNNPFAVPPLFITGKTDYLITSESDDLKNNHRLYQFLDQQSAVIYNYVKRIKTRVLFTDTAELTGPENPLDRDTTPQDRFREYIRRQTISPKDIANSNERLKAMKISRQIRSKITKIFYNYNNAIQDSILLVYFIDFNSFIHSLLRLIEKAEKNWRDHCDFKQRYLASGNATSKDLPTDTMDQWTVENMEERLKKMIEIFEEGYGIRMLNCYQYEDINDFDLDFNSNIQNLLASYTTLVTQIGKLFYPDQYQYVPVVQLNYNNTVSDYYSINYNVYHLLSPEFVFFTVTKEILNAYNYRSEGQGDSIRRLKVRFYDILKGDSYRQLRILLRDTRYVNYTLIDLDYLFIDSIRLFYTCRMDFKLFAFWFWKYNFQNASLYDTIGTLSEIHFKKELFRLMFLARMYNFDVKENDCPIPEIQHYWDRYYFRFSDGLKKLFSNEDVGDIVRELKAKALLIPDFKEMTRSPGSDPIFRIWQSRLKVTAFDESKIDDEISNKRANNIEVIFPEKEFGYFYKSLELFKTKFAPAIRNGEPVLYEEKLFENPLLYVSALAYSYLDLLYQENKKVRLLRRSWEYGTPMMPFIKYEKEEFLYAVDQTGGVFFNTPCKLNHYSRMSNAVLQTLWHFSLVMKKQQFID